MKFYLHITILTIYELVSSQECRVQNVTGLSTTTIECDNTGQRDVPFWLINDTLYDLSNIPNYNVPVGFSSLTIYNITAAVNNTNYQCLGNEVHQGRCITLVLYAEASEDATERWCCLPLNYQKTLIGIEETTIEWISDCDDSLNISIQFFTWFNIINNNLDQQETHIVMLNNTSNSITIPTSNLTNSMGEQVYFRIIAKNTTIDAISSKNKMIFFNVSHVPVQRCVTPGSSLCFNITKTDLCNGTQFVWSNESCICPLDMSKIARDCRNNCTMPIMVTDETVCLNASMNGTLVHFRCFTHCNMSDTNSACKIMSLISSYHIIIETTAATSTTTARSQETLPESVIAVITVIIMTIIVVTVC